ncbi:MAG: NMD3-related protein [Candidatus Nanoarchaeia archaeon]|nr:NMD3-related protein [Candidatus Nanoarchaeia archaeon]
MEPRTPKSFEPSRSNYYEAIVQIRPRSNEVLDFIGKEVEKRNDVFISKIVEKKFGYDVYLNSQRFTRNVLAKKLKAHFRNAEIKSSRALFSRSRMSSKEIYRSTILIRLKESIQ